MGIQINGNTNNINAGIGSLSIEDLNELHIVGVATATRFDGETNGLVNVKTYGAVGDGTTDDRAAIQSAINSAKTVFFPAGSYRVGAALTVWESNSALIGHESLPTIKVVGTGYSGPVVSVQSAGNDINEFSRIENLKFVFDNNSGGPATYSSTPNETNCGVSINGSLAGIASATNRVLRFKMENCRVLGFSNAINLKETTNTLLRRVVIEHEFDQSSTTLSSSNIYCGVNFDGTPGQVGGISPQASVELHQVIFNGSGAPTNTTSMGFRVTGQDPRDIFFEGCETAHGNYGWFIDPSDDDYNIDLHINRPIIDTVDTTGIYVKDWNGYGALTINGGYIVKDENNTGAGIWVENSRGVNITGGIQVLGTSLNNVANDEGIRIKDSKICSVTSATVMNCRYGISLQDSSNCSVTGNIVGAGIGTFTGGTNPVLSDAIRVFGFDGDPSDNNTITGNTIKGASASYKYSNGIGINTTSATENIISSNSIDDSSVTNRITDIGIRTNIIDRGFIGLSTTTGGKLLVGGGTGSAIQFNDSSTRLEIPAANTLAAYTSSSEKVRITSAGRVGIGITTPDCMLHVAKASAGTMSADSNAVLALENSDHCVLNMMSPADKSSYIMMGDPDDLNAGQIRYDNNINELLIDVNGDERLRIASTGQVKFKGGEGGTEAIRVESEGGGAAIHIANFQGITDTGDTTRLGVGKNDNALIFINAAGGSTQVQNFAIGTSDGTPLVLSTNNTERIRFKGDGKTQFSNATDNIIHTSSNSSRLRLFGGSNESVNNGGVLTLHGVSHSSGNYTDLAAGNGGHIQFRIGTNEKLRITNGGFDPGTDAVTDIGNSSKRFRDLYLSSGIFLGGTGSSNELEDYEEGHYTPTATTGAGGNITSTTSFQLQYIKIGRSVQIWGRLHFNVSAFNVTSFTLSLPFANSTGNKNDVSAIMHLIRGNGGDPVQGIRIFRITPGGSTMTMQNHEGQTEGYLGTNTPHLNVNISYLAAS